MAEAARRAAAVIVRAGVQRSGAAIGDEAVTRIVGGYGDRHAVSGDDLDVEAPHAPADLGDELLAFFRLDAKLPPAMTSFTIPSI